MLRFSRVPAEDNTLSFATLFRFAAIVFLTFFGANAMSCSRSHREAAVSVEGTPGEAEAIFHLESFVLNLSDPGQRAYLRVGLDLGLSRPINKGEDSALLGPVRDTIIGVLGQGKADELATPKGKEQLKQDLLRSLQERIPSLGVRDVYFTEFLIQR